MQLAVLFEREFRLKGFEDLAFLFEAAVIEAIAYQRAVLAGFSVPPNGQVPVYVSQMAAVAAGW